MPKWIPEPKWIGQDVYIIGGGTSLKGFDWNLLKGKRTIGCNAAFILGADICNICIFGDTKFFNKYSRDLESFKGIVATNDPHLQKNDLPWLWTMPRSSVGLHVNSLGWNYNTGASAINLALILGAKRIYLLGFDMKLSKDKKMNWHKKGCDKPDENICHRMNENFYHVFKDWKKKFDDREIINVTDDSALKVFPKVGVKEFWQERTKNNG